jgi:MFS family permease
MTALAGQSTGRKPPTPGSARAALSHRNYRLVYFGSFSSNIGSWAQTVVLGPFAYRLANDSASFAGVSAAAQHLPVLLFATTGGVLANRLPRKQWMICGAVLQACFAMFLAWVVVQPSPSKVLFLLGVAGGGFINAISVPTYQAVLPELCGRENLSGAIALNSVQMNGARVIGPILVALAHLNARNVFIFNAATFLFVIVAYAMVEVPNAKPGPKSRLGDGFRYARSNPVAKVLLPTMASFSLMSLAYIGQFQTVAERVLDMDSTGRMYKWLYGTWGLGACLGALAMATVLAQSDKRKLIRPGFAGFALSLAAFGLNHRVVLAFPIGFVLGVFYFGTVTAMLTVVQQHLSSRFRGPVMALWLMCFGGTIPFAALGGGWLMDRVSPTYVLLGGAAWAAFLAARTNVLDRSEQWRQSEDAAAD